MGSGTSPLHTRDGSVPVCPSEGFTCPGAGFGPGVADRAGTPAVPLPPGPSGAADETEAPSTREPVRLPSAARLAHQCDLLTKPPAVICVRIAPTRPFEGARYGPECRGSLKPQGPEAGERTCRKAP